MDDRRLAELCPDPVLVGERRLDHLPLHLAVERHRDLTSRVVLADVDQRVLLGELRERDPQPLPVGGIGRRDDRLEGRRREVVLDVRTRLAEPVADLDLRQPPELRDLARVHLVALHGVAVREDTNRGDLAGIEPVAHFHGSGEHTGVGDPVASRAALDLEDAGRERAVAVARACGQQPRERVHHVLHSGTGERRAEEDGMELADARALGELVVGRPERRERRRPRSERSGRAHRHDRRRQALLDLVEHPFRVGPHPVDLVHE